MDVQIRQLGPGDEGAVAEAAHLFDEPPLPEATAVVLTNPTHHLLVAYDGQGQPVGFISGVEVTYPDKVTEMSMNELGVDDGSRGRGVGSSLVDALLDVARERQCSGAWILTEEDNAAAVGTYRSRGGGPEHGVVMFSWSFGD